jgi:hypothetical protein
MREPEYRKIQSLTDAQRKALSEDVRWSYPTIVANLLFWNVAPLSLVIASHGAAWSFGVWIGFAVLSCWIIWIVCGSEGVLGYDFHVRTPFRAIVMMLLQLGLIGTSWYYYYLR